MTSLCPFHQLRNGMHERKRFSLCVVQFTARLPVWPEVCFFARLIYSDSRPLRVVSYDVSLSNLHSAGRCSSQQIYWLWNFSIIVFFFFLFWRSVEITPIRDIVERAFWQKSKTPSCKTVERRPRTPRSNCASIYVQGVSGFFVQTTRVYSSSKNNQFYTNVDLWKASWSIVDNILVVRLVSIVRKRVRIVSASIVSNEKSISRYFVFFLLNFFLKCLRVYIPIKLRLISIRRICCWKIMGHPMYIHTHTHSIYTYVYTYIYMHMYL